MAAGRKWSPQGPTSADTPRGVVTWVTAIFRSLTSFLNFVPTYDGSKSVLPLESSVTVPDGATIDGILLYEHDHTGGAMGAVLDVSGGVTDHGELDAASLLDDDHTQYSLVDGTRDYTSTVGGVDPVADSDFVTKGFLDSTIADDTGSDNPCGTGYSDGSGLPVVLSDFETTSITLPTDIILSENAIFINNNELYYSKSNSSGLAIAKLNLSTGVETVLPGDLGYTTSSWASKKVVGVSDDYVYIRWRPGHYDNVGYHQVSKSTGTIIQTIYSVGYSSQTSGPASVYNDELMFIDHDGSFIAHYIDGSGSFWVYNAAFHGFYVNNFVQGDYVYRRENYQFARWYIPTCETSEHEAVGTDLYERWIHTDPSLGLDMLQWRSSDYNGMGVANHMTYYDRRGDVPGLYSIGLAGNTTIVDDADPFTADAKNMGYGSAFNEYDGKTYFIDYDSSTATHCLRTFKTAIGHVSGPSQGSYARILDLGMVVEEPAASVGTAGYAVATATIQMPEARVYNGFIDIDARIQVDNITDTLRMTVHNNTAGTYFGYDTRVVGSGEDVTGTWSILVPVSTDATGELSISLYAGFDTNTYTPEYAYLSWRFWGGCDQ